MADEQIEQVEEVVEEETQTNKSRGIERNKDLSEKVKLTAEERDKERQAREAAEKEVSFYKGFTKITSKYPQAADHEDKIREKVLAGYDVEDAAVAVLNKAGKLIPPKQDKEIVAGGSAINQPAQGVKTPREMSQAERLAALKEAEARGDIGMN